MDVNEYLRSKEITLADVLSAAQSVLRLSPGDILFLSGSLVEGIGNIKSDLDLFLLTNRRDIEFTACLTDVGIVVGSCLVDVRVLQHEAVDELVSRFERWASQPRIPRRAFELVLDERKFLYRLAIGKPLYGEEHFYALAQRVDKKALARHKLDWARHLASSFQIDLIGLRSDADHVSMILAAQELLANTADGLIAAFGEPNPNTKWRLRHLSHLPDNWESELAGRKSGLSAVERYLNLHRTPERLTFAAVQSWAQRIAAFSRSVFPCAERKLLSARPLFPSQAFLARYRPESSNSPLLPALDLDVQIQFQDESFDIVRLNEQGAEFRLSDEAYAALCLFDGETRVSETTLPATLLDETTTLVKYAKMEAPTILDEELLSRILGKECTQVTDPTDPNPLSLGGCARDRLSPDR